MIAANATHALRKFCSDRYHRSSREIPSIFASLLSTEIFSVTRRQHNIFVVARYRVYRVCRGVR
jgi:hypothetical protein